MASRKVVRDDETGETTTIKQWDVAAMHLSRRYLWFWSS